MQRIQRPAGSRDDAIELQAYVDVLRRRRRFVALMVGLFLILAVGYSWTRAPVYTASSEVLVQPPDSSLGFRPDQLVSVDTEARLVTSATIAEIAKTNLGSSLSVRSLLEHVTVETTPDTLVLDILYSASGPDAAAAGANAFARAYLEYRRDSAQESLTRQRNVLQGLIDDSTAERDRQNVILEEAAPGSAEFRNAQAQRDTLNGQIAILTSQLAQIPVVVDPGQVILPASPPLGPSSPNHAIDVVLGAFLGVFVGVVGAFVGDRIDDRIRTRADLEACVRAPVLAVIPRVVGWHREGPAWLVTERQPGSAGAEAFRLLRTSVMAMGRQRQVKVIAIVGATLGEGKTSTTANLASALAHADNRVLAISADLRKPRLHQFFNVPNDLGLSDLLSGRARLHDVVRQHDRSLFVIPGGTPTARPAELLESDDLEEFLKSVRDSFDFVLVDTPPVLGLADTLAVAPLVDAVLLVAQCDTSRRSALIHAQEELQQVGAFILGCVLTNVSIGRDDAYRYGYGSSYGSDAASGPARAVPTPGARAVSSPRARPPARAGERTPPASGGRRNPRAPRQGSQPTPPARTRQSGKRSLRSAGDPAEGEGHGGATDPGQERPA